jgi:flagellar M-ring protein FliF
MDVLSNLLQRMRHSLATMSFNQKVILGIVVVAAAVSLFVFQAFVRSDSMVVLYNGLDADAANDVMDALSQEGAKFEIGGGGRTILVPAGEFDRLRLITARVVGDGHSGWREFLQRNSMGATQRELDAAERYAMEGELARSIETLQSVAKARVHIDMPSRSDFLRSRRPASASVVVSLRGRMTPTRDQVESIQFLVAGYVPELSPEGVNVIDAASQRVLSAASANSATGKSNAQLRAQQEVEDYLASKASQVLTPVLGAHAFVVRVGADLDFEELERVAEIYDPQTVVRSEGTAESEDPTKSRGVTNYEVNKTVDRVLRNGSTLRKLTVSVAVDGAYTPAPDGGAPTYVPRSEDSIAQIQRVVAAAVGLDPSRGDTITVENLQFDPIAPVEPDLLDRFGWMHELPDLVGRFLLFLVAAIMVLGLRRSLGQALGAGAAPVGARAGAAVAGGAGEEVFHGVHAEVATLEDWARGNPEQVADLVKAFATQED